MCLAYANNPPVYSFPAFLVLSLNLLRCVSEMASVVILTIYPTPPKIKRTDIPCRVSARRNPGVKKDAAVVSEMIEFAELKNVCEAEMNTALQTGMISFAVYKSV